MTKQEAYDTLLNYISSFGSVGVEYWTDRDREKAGECLNTLMYGHDNGLMDYPLSPGEEMSRRKE